MSIKTNGAVSPTVMILAFATITPALRLAGYSSRSMDAARAILKKSGLLIR